MLSFKSILVAVAAFASIVSAVPSPEVGNGLNIAQRSPQAVEKQPIIKVVGILGGLPLVGGLLGWTDGDGSRDGAKKGDDNDGGKKGDDKDGGRVPVKRGGLSCKEVVQNGHNGIAELVIKISQ